LDRTHFTLKPIFNVAMLAVYAAVILAAVSQSSSSTVLAVVLGCCLGVVGGILQRSAFAGADGALLSAKGAIEIRRILTAKKSGRIYIGLLWTSVPLIAMVQLLLRREPVLGLLAGYGSFALLRDLLTLPLTLRLRTARAQEADAQS
jgi:hypothetical protein